MAARLNICSDLLALLVGMILFVVAASSSSADQGTKVQQPPERVLPAAVVHQTETDVAAEVPFRAEKARGNLLRAGFCAHQPCLLEGRIAPCQHV